MKTLLKSTLLLVIGLSMSSLSAFSMITIGVAGEEEKPNEKQSSISQQQATFDKTALARRATDEECDLNANSSVEGRTTFTGNEKTYRKIMEEEESLSDTEEPWPVKIPADLPEVDKTLLQKILKNFSPEVLRQYHSGLLKPSKKKQSIIDGWRVQGVTINPEFVDTAIAIREKAQAITARAATLEATAEKIFENLERKQYYAAAIHHSDQFIEAAAQARDAWIKTAEMHQQIPGRQWGLRLKDIWARKFDEWQQQREKVQQDFLEGIEKISRNAVTDIAEFRKIGANLVQERKYNEAAYLSGAYEKIIIAQRALPSRFSEGTLSMLRAIKLELGLESLKAAMLQAKLLKYQTMLENEVSESEMKEQTTNESILTFRASLQGKFSDEEIETEKRNHIFEQRATALENYASKTLETVYDCFSIFTIGGEFADQTDVNDLAAAYDKVETAAWVLNALKAATVSGEQDPWFQEEKQEIAIGDLEQAIQEAHNIAARIGNKEVYEQDNGIDEILADLQKNKDEYEAVLKNQK